MPTERAHGLQVAKTCEALVAQGILVTLIVPRRATLKETIFEYYRLPRQFPVLYLSTWDLTGKIPLVGFLLQSITFVVSAFWYLVSTRYVGTVYTRDQFVAFLLSFLIKNRIVFEMHAIPHHAQWLYRIMLKRMFRVVVISKGLRDAVLRLGVPSGNVFVAHDGYDPIALSQSKSVQELREELHVPQDAVIVCYVGSLLKWKGVDTLFTAALALPQKYYTLIVGGTGKAYESLLTAVRTRSQGRIDVRPRTSHHEAQRYIAASDIMVLPNSAKEDISRLYTSPLKLFEYLASGKPLVVSNLPSLREVADHYEGIYYFQPDDADNLAAAIQRIEVGRHYSRDTKQYSWESRARLIISALYGE